MSNPFNLSKKIPDSINSVLFDFLEMRYKHFYKANQDIIDDYLYMKEKLVELEARLNLNYTLSVTNSKTSGKLVNAKLKLPYAKNTKNKSKYPYFNIHVGKLENYKKGLKDPLLLVDAEKKIMAFIDKKHPLHILGSDNQQLIFLYN